MIGVLTAVLLLVLVLVPLALRVLRGPTLVIRAVSSREVRAPAQLCSDYLRDAANLGEYEPKVTRCTVGPRRADGCTYRCRGWFFGVPWQSTFDLRHTHDGGFTSEVVQGAKGVVSGGFVLAPVDEGRTRVTHWELYRFPVWIPMLWALRGTVEAWLQRTVDVEVAVVTSSIERRAPWSPAST